jgi:hypothetical protein
VFRRFISNSCANEERKDLFGPVADLMVGVIFIFIILLIGLALNLQPEDYQRLRDRNAQLNELLNQITAANDMCTKMLEDMQRQLQKQGIKVTIDPSNGTLKLPAGGLFLAGQAEPTMKGQQTICQLGSILVGTLPCYTNHPSGTNKLAGCQQANLYSTLSSVYIEGHTDIVPINTGIGRFHDNWDLSAARAIETYKILREAEPLLRDLRNQDGDSLLGVSGYAETRPANLAKDRLLETVRDLDRRIEVRLTMSANTVALRQAIQDLNKQLENHNEFTR